jgi:hypothetical protein
MRIARFTDELITRVSSFQPKLDRLLDLVLERTKNAGPVNAETARVAAAGAAPTPAQRRHLARFLFDDLRVSEPDNYGQLLHEKKLINWWTYWLSFRSGRTVVMSLAILGAVLTIGVPAYRWSKPVHGNYWLAWQQSRFVRPTVTAADEFRNRKELQSKLNAAAFGPGLAKSLAEELTRRDIPVESAQRVLDFLLFSHNDTVTPWFAPELMAALRAPNPDVRLRIHRTLKELQAVQFPKHPLTGAFESLDKWVPAEQDSAGTIDGHIQNWIRWWNATKTPSTPSD